jgi:SHS2 domain-containing protein
MSRDEPARARHDFEFVDRVTSDISFVARGASVSDVFASAAAALLAATVEEPEGVEDRQRRSIALVEPDLELLLLRFLNELVYLRDAQQFLTKVVSLRISTDDGARLEAELGGERIDRSRHVLIADVKAATAHDLRVARENGRWIATVTLDV